MPISADPTDRFVLPPDAPWLRNLAALWAVQPKLAAELEATDAGGPDPSLVVEPSKSGPPTLLARTVDGKTVALHSRYDPLGEARRLAEGIKTESCVVFYVLGMGLGYHVEALFDAASAEAMHFVFEADARVLCAALRARDYSRLIDSGRVCFMVGRGAEKSELFTRLTPYAAMCSMGFEGLVHAPSLGLHPAFYRQTQELLTEFVSFGRTCLTTLLVNGRRTAENITRNLAWYAATPSVSDLGSAYKGKPAIIVSAGPSLRKNKQFLKDADGKAVIIAVQTILQPLIEMGIEPQFVTALDYHDISARYYEKLPPDLKTQLVAEPKASNAIFEAFPGPVTILGNDYADRLLRANAPQPAKGRLSSGSTVAHLAYYLAEHLGCDPIIFVGQDLGFGDGLAYAPGTNIDDVWRPEFGRFCTPEMRQWEFIARDRKLLRKIPDFQGRPMYTEERLFTYLQQFERDFLRTKTRIIDATEGGAAKRGATLMPLADAIREFCKEPLPAERPGDGKPGMQWLRTSQCVASLQARREEAREIEMVSRDTLPLLEEIRDHLADDQPRVNRAIARVDALRARMDGLGPTYDLITQLTQVTELQRFQNDRKITAAKLTGEALQKRQIERDVENVKAVGQAAREFQKLMEEVIGRLTAFTDPEAARYAKPAGPAPSKEAA
ncbi:MAG: 6-hydroxymethylpterin diphosphokinase MptE-like protein [Phycisphaerae bacterium]|nr:6-hydroxymethylpterin diphosphokinase MptE-like protein [Tepidisphaeraceae bacterium]